MDFLQALIEFFENIFKRNSPAVKRRLALKKIENDLRSFEPTIYEDGMLSANFAEALRIVFMNIKRITDVLNATVSCQDKRKAKRFEGQLVITGLPFKEQGILSSLRYEERKAEFQSGSAFTTSQLFDNQRRALERITNMLRGNEFRKIDKEILKVRQLSDIGNFAYFPVIKLFDQNYNYSIPAYEAAYKNVPIENLSSYIKDLYFVLHDFEVTNSTVSIIYSLAKLAAFDTEQEFTEAKIKRQLKSVRYILKNVISSEKLKTILCFAHANADFKPEHAVYGGSPSSDFSKQLVSKFNSDEVRIKTELRDENVKREVTLLFEGEELLTLDGYNDETNALLLESMSLPFSFIMPLRILKTFVTIYLSDGVKTLLNNLVVEGFFNKPEYKTQFSEAVYAAVDSASLIKNFESKFMAQRPYSVANIEGYINDIQKDSSFSKNLEELVASINSEAQSIITGTVGALTKLSKHLRTILAEMKMPNSRTISNLKVLMFSSRNKENTSTLELQFKKWEKFFNIMKNYSFLD